LLWTLVTAVDTSVGPRKTPAFFVPPDEHLTAVWTIEFYSPLSRHDWPVTRRANRKLNLFLCGHVKRTEYLKYS
jgi:hypothetical protein